jgi:hypothetical protein
LRTPKAADTGIEVVPELDQVVGSAVGQGSVGARPDILGRIELGRIRGEIVDVQPGVSREEIPHLPAPVGGAAIPEQIHGAAKVPEQMLQKGPDVEAREIAWATAQVERQPAPFG